MQKIQYQHEPLRVPQKWEDQERTLVYQIDRLFDEVFNKLAVIRDLQDTLSTKIDKSSIKNNLTTTSGGYVLDARQGKALKDAVDTKVDNSAVKNNLTTTSEGYVLDARQGKALNDAISDRVVGKRQYKSIAASTNICRIDLPAGYWLLVLSIPTINRVWVGLVVCDSEGGVTFEQINSSTGLTVTAGTSLITVTFSASYDTNLNMVDIPLRGDDHPSFH